MRNGNDRDRRSNYGSRMSEPRAGHFRTPKKENGRRIGKNADTSIRHGARKERRGDGSIKLLTRTTRAEQWRGEARRGNEAWEDERESESERD